MWAICVDSKLHIPHGRWDKGCSPLLSAGRGNEHESSWQNSRFKSYFQFGLFEANNNEHKHCDRILTAVSYTSTFFRVTSLILRTWQGHISRHFDECLMFFPGEYTAHLVSVSNSYLMLQSIICQKLKFCNLQRWSWNLSVVTWKKGVTTFHSEEDNVLAPAGYARDGVGEAHSQLLAANACRV